MLDELLLGGEVQETSKKNVLKAIAAQDLLQEVRLKHLLPSMFENLFLVKLPMGYSCFFWKFSFWEVYMFILQTFI